MSDFNYTQFPIPAKPLSGVGETSYASAILGIAPGGVKKIPTESFLASAGIYPVGLLQCSVPTPVQVYGAGDDEYTKIPVMADTSVSGGSTGVSTGGLSIVTTGANAGGVSVSEAGLYRISAAVRIKRGTGTSLECGCLVVKNGTTPLSVVYDEADTDEAFSIVCPTVVASLASGDVISLNGAYLGGSSDYVIFAPGTAWETLPIASTSVLVIERLNNSYGSSSGTPSLAEVAAEVEDIREGYDGTEYASAGEAVRAQIEEVMQNTLSNDFKIALEAAFAHVAWDDDDPTGQSYLTALHNSLYPVVISSISCVYTQTAIICTADSLNSLKEDLVVTAHWSDGTTTIIPGDSYTLSGALTAGTSTITVSYYEKTATFNVTVRSATKLFEGAPILARTSTGGKTELNADGSATLTTTASTNYNVIAQNCGNTSLFKTFSQLAGHRIRVYVNWDWNNYISGASYSQSPILTSNPTGVNDRLRYLSGKGPSSFVPSGEDYAGYVDWVLPTNASDWLGTGNASSSSYVSNRGYLQANAAGAKFTTKEDWYDLGVDT